jgi:hypothetical protein
VIARVTIETDEWVFVAERVVVEGPFVSNNAEYVWDAETDKFRRVKHTLTMDNEILENDDGVVYTVTDKKRRVGRNRRGYEYGG